MIGVLCAIVIIIILLAVGVPIAITLIVAAFVGLLISFGPNIAFAELGTSPYTEVSSYTLLAVPLFILMGSVGSAGRLWFPLFEFAYALFGRFRGGLAMAIVGAAAIFGAASGSSTSAAAALGRIAIPEAAKFGYNRNFILGTIAASGTFAIMIPPSITLIIYAALTGLSIGELFMAGILPGLLSAAIYLVVIRIMAGLRPDWMPTAENQEPKKVIGAGFRSLPVMFVIVAVLGGIYGGVFTPTEAGGIGFALVVLLGLVTRSAGLRALWGAGVEAVETTAMIMLILVGAFMFGHLMAIARVPNIVVEFISGLAAPSWVILGGLLVVFIILGTFMGQLAIQVLTIPIVFPIILELGYDPIWFAILFVKTVEIGLITPPVGMNIFVIASVAKIAPEEAFKGVLPFFIGDLIALGLILGFPAIATFLPSMMAH